MKKVLIITGEAGAGKSSAVKHLEDLGFYCIDNVPPALVPELLSLVERNPEIERVALVADVRNPEFKESAGELFKKIKEEFPEIEIWYFTADKDALINRFKETRRPHPFQRYYPDESLERLIEREKEFYQRLKDSFDRVIDTTNLTYHDLKRLIKELLETGKPQLQVNFLSFGFKYGIPHAADNVFDVRFLPNPHFVPHLKEKTGMESEVEEFVMSYEESRKTLETILDFVRLTLPLYEREGKAYITYAVGCTGGQHRSVVFAEALANRVAEEFPQYEVYVEHREQKVRRKVNKSKSTKTLGNT